MSLFIVLTIFFILYYIIAAVAIVHCLLHSKYPQGALAWCGVIFMLPAVGAFLYFIFGVNRIDSRAVKLFNQAASAGHTGMPIFTRTVPYYGNWRAKPGLALSWRKYY